MQKYQILLLISILFIWGFYIEILSLGSWITQVYLKYGRTVINSANMQVDVNYKHFEEVYITTQPNSYSLLLLWVIFYF